MLSTPWLAATASSPSKNSLCSNSALVKGSLFSNSNNSQIKLIIKFLL
ncbi:hypothetical protein GW537_14300 [Piscirickettsia salmonis]|nr:hypothetical protein [Piscirickettsia salmonis]QHS30044.1 hypothetical protein GW537_14300 [Piscirickettsia salmonis]